MYVHVRIRGLRWPRVEAIEIYLLATGGVYMYVYVYGGWVLIGRYVISGFRAKIEGNKVWRMFLTVFMIGESIY